MRKLSFLVLLSSIISILFISCNKDDGVSPGGGSTPVVVTNTFPKTGSVPIILGETNDTLNIDSSGTINSLSFALNDIETVNAVNVDIFLLHGGVTDTLLYRTTNNGTNFINTVFSDTASTSIQNGSGDFTGYFRPYSPLSKFNGLNINGQWILKFISRVAERTGVIKSWGITITYNRVQTPTIQIFPTAIGNTWKLEGRNALGNIYGYDTLRITETMLYQGKTLYRVIDYDNPDTMYVSIESDGAYIWSKFGGSTFGNQLMWKYPINVGEIYIGGGNGDTVKCLSVNETVTTPSGTYTGCIKYEIHDMGQINTYFYMKPGIGIVGIDHLINGDYERLYSYQLYK